jgi:hypothetical protein
MGASLSPKISLLRKLYFWRGSLDQLGGGQPGVMGCAEDRKLQILFREAKA